MRKTNWSRIKDQTYVQTAQGRNVYDEQQLERGALPEKQTMLSRTILCLIISLIVSLFVYFTWGMIASMASGIGSSIGTNSSTMTSVDETNHDMTDENSKEDGYFSEFYQQYNQDDVTEDAKSKTKTTYETSGYRSKLYQEATGETFTVTEHTEVIEDAEDSSYSDSYEYSDKDSYEYESENTDVKSDSTYNTKDTNSTQDTSGSTGLDFSCRSKAHLFVSILAGFLTFSLLYPFMKRNLDAQNMLADTSDINQYTNDQHIQLPEEIQRRYDWFPDVGAHSSVQVSSMISHMALQNKGIKNIQVAKRYHEDVVDEDGTIVYYKGEIMRDENEDPIYEEQPLFDTEFATDLFTASGMPDNVHYSYDVKKIPYNPGGSNRDKLKYDSVSSLINGDWTFPDYEPQRPAGAYIVDTQPVNTMVLAITRAGKGQTIIEPTLDMWTRELRPNNMVINDPKGELLLKFYPRAAIRGFQIVQFNLINSMKTDIYNPLGMAAQSAREGDFTKCATYVENIAEVFFPTDGGEDPVWPNAANNAFKRAAYGLIDYYLEKEERYRSDCDRRIANGEVIDKQTIEAYVDSMWGRVTLYNCYQMFVQLTSKKIANPAKEFAQKMKSGGFEGVPPEIVEAEAEKVNKQAELWNGSPEADCLTLYFNATDKLPRNSMRDLISNVNNALKSMAGAEKMMASVYGIAITAMSFFTDPTISTLTSGTPSQTVDLAGLSFPRRVGVRFHSDFIKHNHYVGLQAKWDAFEDRNFTKSLGKLFEHSDTISREGWARYYFDGKFEKDIAYIRLRLFNPSTNVFVKDYYFEFHKGYQTSLDGRTYVKDPVLGTKIVKNGVIYELVKNSDGKFVPGETKFKRKLLKLREHGFEETNYDPVEEKIPAIIQTYVKYTEKPKMVFLVTPPHLMKYAKLILILVKQLVDLNFDQSYMTKKNQKPLYKTRYMLDELGNLQSEGHGISGFQTMLSIGLGQDQQFTLILQTLQQLKDVYGVMILSTNRVAAYL